MMMMIFFGFCLLNLQLLLWMWFNVEPGVEIVLRWASEGVSVWSPRTLKDPRVLRLIFLSIFEGEIFAPKKMILHLFLCVCILKQSYSLY